MSNGLMPGTTLRPDVSSGRQGENRLPRIEGVNPGHIAIRVLMGGLGPRPFAKAKTLKTRGALEEWQYGRGK